MGIPISKSLIIGLGGTGQKIVVSIKKKMYQNYGEIPNFINFLYIDVDSYYNSPVPFSYEYKGKTIHSEIDILPNERFQIPKRNIKDYYDNIPAFSEFLPIYFYKNFDDSRESYFVKGIRIWGKIFLSSEYLNIKQRIGNNFSQLISASSSKYLDNNNGIVKVFIVGSLAGGSGSGMFIDIANIVYSTNVLKDENIELVGFFSMPSFFESLPSTQNISANTYGAFHELDYLQDPATDYGKHVNSFDNHSISTKRFDAIYIMDNILSNNTLIDKETMESATASAIANLVSAIGDEMDSMSVNNPQFDKFTMEGKRRGYSGFGICELVLRRSQLIDFIINKLILNALENYLSSNYKKNEIDSIHEEFILNNGLNDGVGMQAKYFVNRLLDPTFTIDSPELKVHFASPELGEYLIEELNASFVLYKKELKQKAQNLLLAYRKNIFNDNGGENRNIHKGIKTSLIEIFDNLLYSEGGLHSAMYFSDILAGILSKTQKELSNNLREHEYKMSVIEDIWLEEICYEIKAKQKGVFSVFKKNQIKKLLDNYLNLVSNNAGINSIRYHFLEIIRKKEAIKIYQELIEICKDYFGYSDFGTPIGKVEMYQAAIHEAIKEVGLSIRQFVATYERPKNNIHIELNHFFTKIIEGNQVFNNLVKNFIIDIPLCLKETKNINNLLDNLKERFRESITKNETILSKLAYNYPVEELVREFSDTKIKLCDKNGDVKEVEFKNYLTDEINNNLSVMWKHKSMNVPYDQKDGGDSTCLPELILIAGIYDEHERFIINEIAPDLVMDGDKPFNFVGSVSTHNSDIISLQLEEHAVPAFMIEGMDKYREDFIKLSKCNNVFYFYSDKRFEIYAKDLFPLKSDEKALRIWVQGFFTDLIYNKNQGYYIKSSSGSKSTDVKCYDDSSNKGKNDRCNAFEYFAESEIFPSEINQKFERMLSRDQEKLRKDLLDYFHNEMYTRKSIGKFEKSLEDNEKELLFKEERMLIQIGLDELNMHSRDFIKPGLEGNELEEYKYYLQDLGAEEVF